MEQLITGQPEATDQTTWYPVRRAFGPVTFERVGFAYAQPDGGDAQLSFLLDASLAVGGLVLTLDGLAVTVSLADLAAVPDFALRGLGLAYQSGDLEIAAAFLADTIEYDGRTLPAYNGKAVLRTGQFSLGALGSYVQLPEGPSLFVYAFLDYPIGGPPVFFVEGLAAGFGYHRRLVAPPVEQVASFPLVAEAAGGRGGTADVAGELRALRDYIPPSPGDFFLAVGVHFSSFRMVDSVVLLSIGFGHRFEVNLLGLSTLVLPSPDAVSAGTPALAEVQLALRATLVPDDGYFALQAQLTQNSYLLSKDCKLTGGFAFQVWFGTEHTGDFVLTAGGYHPKFTKPDHYPLVPRLGFTWQVSPQLSMKGSGYFALTPSALMAGGSFSATWNSGPARAWFSASMDFFIGWKPYYYEADIQVAVGASYTFTLFGTHTVRADVSAQVSLWGPKFSVRATVDLGIYSFTVESVQSPKGTPPPIGWSLFQESFLPAADALVTVVLRGGGAGGGGNSGELGPVNPVELVLLTDSAIPSRAARRGPQGADRALDTGAATTAFGVAPLGRDHNTPLASTHRIEISRTDGTHVEDYFQYQPVTKNLPAALWGDRLVPQPADPALVSDLLTGYLVRPLPPAEPAAPPGLPRAVLAAATALDTQQDAYRWVTVPQFTPTADDPAARQRVIGQTITDASVSAVRAAVATAFAADEPEPDLTGFDVADFLAVPLVGAAG